jgi:hypothetical protein
MTGIYAEASEQQALVNEVKSPDLVRAIVTGPLCEAVHNAPAGVRRRFALSKFKMAIAEVEGPGIANQISVAMGFEDDEPEAAQAAA